MKLNLQLLPKLVSYGDSLQIALQLPEYFSQGQCVGKDSTLFDGETLVNILEAKATCAGCPIRKECLEWALEREPVGIWGATTPNERSAILSGRPAINIGELQLLQQSVSKLMSTATATSLALEFGVTTRTIQRWRNEIQDVYRAS